jgi:hypothetical protein
LLPKPAFASENYFLFQNIKELELEAKFHRGVYSDNLEITKDAVTSIASELDRLPFNLEYYIDHANAKCSSDMIKYLEDLKSSYDHR